MDAELFVRNFRRLRIENAHDDRFAIIAGNERDTHLNLTVLASDAEAAVLCAIRDIQFYSREELDARVDLVVGLRVEIVNVSEETVDAQAQACLLLFWLEMNIRGTKCECSRKYDLKQVGDVIKRLRRGCSIELLHKCRARLTLIRELRERLGCNDEDARLRLGCLRNVAVACECLLQTLL